jgi:hypothetical protein
LDTLAKIRQRRGSRDPYEADYEVGAGLQAIAHQFNVAILVIHHLRKMDAEDPLDQISGTTGLTGGCDGSLVLTRRRQQIDAVLHVTGRDIEDDSSLALVWDKRMAAWAVIGPASPEASHPDRQKVIDALFGSAGMTAKVIASQVGDDYESVRKLVARMQEEGEIDIVGGNRNAGYVYGLPQKPIPSIPSIPTDGGKQREVGTVGTVGTGFRGGTASMKDSKCAQTNAYRLARDGE